MQTTVGIMTEFLENLKYRLELAISGAEVKRVLHGRGGTFPDQDYLNIDYYPPAIFITVFKDVDYSHIINELIKIHGGDRPLIVQERFGRDIKSISLGLELPEVHIVEEHGLKYHVSLKQNQNTGLFLDMKDERSKLMSNSEGKNILNLFSYTCSLSVAAKAGGAKQVVNIDQKKTFLNIGRENHRLNNCDDGVVYKSWDVLKSINQIGKFGPFDKIICDPPSNQGKSFFYKKDYEKIIRRMGSFLKVGGEFVACLNTPFEETSFLRDLFKSEGGKWELVQESFSASEYEELNKQNGLKMCTYRRCE
ncbi:MAG: hypothetical protein CES88_16165 [Halobacteriovorax sp. JY17]|nr:MAG: hypothetical protein CES88_16165 [Halobacteriovorax sp. JY17]